MKKILISVFALAGALLWGCEEPEEVIDYNSQDLKITATIEQTRTSVTSSSVAWAAGDEIKLVCENEEYTFTTAEAGQSVEFTSTSGITPATIEGNAVVAYYGCNSLGAFTIPQNQTVKGGVNDAKVPMYAYTAEAPVEAVLPMTFKPAASVLEVVLGSKAIDVKSISLSPAANAMVTGGICGTFNVNALTGKVTAKSALETITVTFDQSQSVENGLSVQIPIGWCTVTGGLKLTMVYNEDNVYEDVIWGNETVSTFAEVDGVQSYKYFVAEVEIDLGPRDWYVKADGDANSKGRGWASATTLSNALVNAAEGSTIHLAAGTYVPENAILGDESGAAEQKSFEFSRQLTLIGGYPANATDGAAADATANVTILDGNDTSYHTVVVTSAEKVTIEGVTIKKGNNATALEIDKEGGVGFVTSAVNDAVIEDKSGAGIYVAAGVVELKNCVVSDNKGLQGAGIYAKDATVTLNGSTVTRNTNTGNGGGVWLWNGELTINDSNIDANGDEENAGVGRGLYIYAEKEKSAKATVKNTSISGNLASASGNHTGIYVRGADATATATATFENCTVSNNKGAMGAGFGTIYSTVTFDGCEFSENHAGNNSNFYLQESSKVVVLNSKFVANTSASGKNGGFLLYAPETDATLYAANSVFENNVSNSRGGAAYLRKNTHATFVNCTFSGNSATSYGSAIALNEAGTSANVISCTFSENENSSFKYGGALSTENAGCTLNVYNSVISGNPITYSGDETISAITDVHCKAGTINYQNVIVGSEVYGADGAVVEGKAFATTDFGAYANGVYPISESSAAWTGGMSAADLYTVGSGVDATIFTETIMKADQKGNSRSGNVMGAYVGK